MKYCAKNYYKKHVKIYKEILYKINFIFQPKTTKAADDICSSLYMRFAKYKRTKQNQLLLFFYAFYTEVSLDIIGENLRISSGKQYNS